MSKNLKIALIVGGVALAGAFLYLVWRRSKMQPALVGDGGVAGQEAYTGQPGSSGREFPVRNRNVLAELARQGGGSSDYEEIYSEPGLRALYEWLSANGGVKLRFRADDDALWWMARWGVPQEIRDAYASGAGVWAVHSNVLLHVAPGESGLDQVRAAQNDGRILSVATDETGSTWYVLKGALQVPVPLADFGLAAMGGKAGSVLVKVAELGGGASGGSVWDSAKDAAEGFAEDAADKAIDYGVKTGSALLGEGLKKAGLDGLLG